MYERIAGSMRDDQYRFYFGPEGFVVTHDDLVGLGTLSQTALQLLEQADIWHQKRVNTHGDTTAAMLETGIVQPFTRGLPFAISIDAVWTTEGWRKCPPTLRYFYGQPHLWVGKQEPF